VSIFKGLSSFIRSKDPHRLEKYTENRSWWNST